MFQNRWLMILLGLSVLMLGIGAATYFWAQRPLPQYVAETQSNGGSQDAENNIKRPVALDKVEQYTVINEKHLFSPGRTAPALPTTVADTGDAEDTDEVSPLNAVLTGIVITPEVKLAIVRSSDSQTSFRAKEGEEFEGEFAGWSVDAIEARKADFSSSRGQAAELELAVHDKTMKEPPKPKRTAQNPAAKPPAADQDGQRPAEIGDKESRAEEIRRRIAERRAQLREEAERRRIEQSQAIEQTQQPVERDGNQDG